MIAGAVFALLAAMGFAPAASANAWLSSSSVTSNDPVSVIVDTGSPPFVVNYVSYRVERSPGRFHVWVRPGPLPPGGEVPPDLEIPLGRLAPGSYTIYVIQDIDALPPVQVLGLQVTAAPVPASNPWWLACLLLTIVAVVAGRARAGTLRRIEVTAVRWAGLRHRST